MKAPRKIMEFRRIPSCYLVVYPTIKEFRDNKPRALWKFAIAAVLNDIRRDHWTWSYFSQRRDDRNTVISLSLRSRWFGTPLSNEEYETICAIGPRLLPDDACFYDSMVDRRRAYTCVHESVGCDSCNGRIGGPRLACLDCAKGRDMCNTVDLCCAPQCVGARITYIEEDSKTVHEPNHRMVKLHSSVLTRNYGRTHTAASRAFQCVEETRRKIAELAFEETGSDELKASSIGPTSTKMPTKSDKSNDVPNPPDGTKGGAKVEGKTARDARQNQVQAESLPTCGKCEGRLSFPFWYCIFCEDDLYICGGCDAEGVPDLTRSSGKHTVEHHLIRCLAPEVDVEEDKTSPTEQRLTSIENRIGNIERLLHKLVAAFESPAV